MAQQADVADCVNSIHSVSGSFREGNPPFAYVLGASDPNGDIIHERGTDFNGFFRQNAKLVKLAHGHLFSCAKHPKMAWHFAAA